MTVPVRLLVTGFGPFPGVPQNPTATMVEAIAARPPQRCIAEVLPTRWTTCDTLAQRAAAADAVLMFGVSSRARRVRYERFALPRATPAPDDAGRTEGRASPRRFATAFDVFALAHRARRAGFVVAVSADPGRYICNAAYGAALSGNSRTLFVHVPMPAAHGPHGTGGLVRHARWLIDALTAGLPHSGTLRPRRRHATSRTARRV